MKHGVEQKPDGTYVAYVEDETQEEYERHAVGRTEQEAVYALKYNLTLEIEYCKSEIRRLRKAITIIERTEEQR